MTRTFNNAAGNLRKWGLATMIAATSIAIAPGTFAQVESGPGVTAATPNAPATAAFAAEMQSRLALVNGMLSRFEADAAATYGADFNVADWRRDFAARLLTRSASELQAAASAPTLAMAQNELFNSTTAQKPSAKHSFESDLKLNLLPNPCRIVDTRAGGGGQLGPAYRLWQAQAAAATIAAQGGNAAGCGQRVSQGWLMVVTVVPSPSYTSPSFITVQHDNFPTPPANATMNYVNQNIASLAFSLSQDTTVGTIGGFYAYSSSLTHVVIDLVGYATHVDAADLDCVKTYVENLAVPANAVFNIAIPGCPTGYSMTGAGCRTPGYDDADWAINGLFSIGAAGPVTAYCAGRNKQGGTITVQGTGRCCRSAAP
jgi:hypothetical protein